ncbi:unnamed protein product [Owenia fusiformis]|uniref:Uncharacterized protein n=1 Tax=Owenia fusiformis TaxID=6347 RepID=A0A8J1UZD4_OWEFU|nr:unnamed protein product [Owenia fusiformis]
MLGLLALCVGIVAAQERLGQYNVDKSQISVSGLSSGGGFTTQFHVVHSASIMGAAPFSGVPYNCMTHHGGDCSQDPDVINIDTLVTDTNNFAANGDIDPVSNLAQSKVFVFHGPHDFFVEAGAGRKIVEYYQRFNADVIGEFDIQAGHGFPTWDYGTDCDATFIPGINRCQYWGAYNALNHIYGGNLQAPDPNTPTPGQFISFDQHEFRNAVSNTAAFDPIGYIYVPIGCQNSATPCRLHVNFHGCFQGRQGWIIDDDEYARNTGYNEVGELNNIIILHPQIEPTDDNPGGCWDWNGLDSADYQTKRGHHVQIVKAMIDRVTG